MGQSGQKWCHLSRVILGIRMTPIITGPFFITYLFKHVKDQINLLSLSLKLAIRAVRKLCNLGRRGRGLPQCQAAVTCSCLYGLNSLNDSCTREQGCILAL